MKYTYKFATSKTTYEYEEKWVKILEEMDQEENMTSDRCFRPSSVEMMQSKGIEIPIISELEEIFKEPTVMDILLSKLPNAISKLKPAQKEIIKLYYFEQKTQEEIAEILGINQSNVSRRIMTAEKNLKKFLEKTA